MRGQPREWSDGGYRYLLLDEPHVPPVSPVGLVEQPDGQMMLVAA